MALILFKKTKCKFNHFIFYTLNKAEAWSYDTPAPCPRRLCPTKEQKTCIKLMSEAPSARFWSCIGVISRESPSTRFLSTLSFTPPGHEEGQSSSLGGPERLAIQGTSPGKTGLEVTAGLWPDEGGSCDAKRLSWHHGWAPWAKVPYPYYMHQGLAD